MVERIWRWRAYGTWAGSCSLAMAGPRRSWSRCRPCPPTMRPLNWLFVAAVFCLGTWILHAGASAGLSAMESCRCCVCVGGMLRSGSSTCREHCAVEVRPSRSGELRLSAYCWTTRSDLYSSRLRGPPCAGLGFQLSHRVWLELTLVAALFLNSSLGRFVVDVTTQYLVRLWRDLRVRVIGSLAQWIMDVFRGLVTTVERTINLIDEWLRLRAGSSRMIRIGKMLGEFLVRHRLCGDLCVHTSGRTPD